MPFPATLVFHLKDPQDSGYELFGLSTQLLSAGLIMAKPRALRRPTGDPARLELVCTFVDATAAGLWELRLSDTLKRWLEENLAEPAFLIAYRDPIFEYDDVRACNCPTRECLCVRGEKLELTGPLICGSCRGYLPAYSVQVRGLCDWSAAHRHVYHLWLASGTLETWAARQLFDFHSELNRDGYALAREARAAYGCPVYYVMSSDPEDEREECPRCRATPEPSSWKGYPEQVCRDCEIAF